MRLLWSLISRREEDVCKFCEAEEDIRGSRFWRTGLLCPDGRIYFFPGIVTYRFSKLTDI